MLACKLRTVYCHYRAIELARELSDTRKLGMNLLLLGKIKLRAASTSSSSTSTSSISVDSSTAAGATGTVDSSTAEAVVLLWTEVGDAPLCSTSCSRMSVHVLYCANCG
jgi:hypothetical protein